MTLTELEYIVALSETKHFGEAAKRCHVSQPTLSTAVKKLESGLNTLLFERYHHAIHITPIGKKIIAQAKHVLAEAALIKTMATAEKSHLSTPLKIGAIYTVAPYLFPTLIPVLKKHAPTLPLLIQEDFTDNLREKLLSGELDAIFVALPFESKEIVKKKLYEEPFVVLLRKDHPLANTKKISAHDLKKENVLLLGKNNCFRDQVISACPSCFNREGADNMEGSSLETLRHMVAAGSGITILPSSATSVQHYQHILCARPLKGHTPQRTIVLAWRTNFPRTKAIDALIQAIHDCALSGICLL